VKQKLIRGVSKVFRFGISFLVMMQKEFCEIVDLNENPSPFTLELVADSVCAASSPLFCGDSDELNYEHVCKK